MSTVTSSTSGTSTDTTAAIAPASTTPASAELATKPAKETPAVGGFDSSKQHLEITPEVGLGVDVWGAGKKNDSYTSFEFKAGPKFRFGADKGFNVWVKPSFVWRDTSKKIENSGDAPKSADFVDPSDTTSTGAEAGEDPFGNDISTGTSETPNENLNYSEATKETLTNVGGELEFGTDFALKNNDKIRWTLSPSLFVEAGGGSGYVDLSTNADGLQKVGGFVGGGARLATNLKIKGKILDLDLGISGDLGGRQVSYTVPGDTANPDGHQWGMTGGGTFTVGVTPHKARTASTTPTIVGATPTGTLSAYEISQIEAATTAGTVASDSGKTTIDTTKVDLKDSTNRPVSKIILVYDDSTKNYLVSVWVKKDLAVADDPATTDVDESLERVEITGIQATYTKPAEFIAALLALTVPAISINTTSQKIEIARGYFFETTSATTLYKGSDASLGKITGTSNGTVIVEVNGIPISEIPFTANTAQDVTIKADKLATLNGPIAVTIRLKDVSGIKRITGYTVADQLPKIATLQYGHVTKPGSSPYIKDPLTIQFKSDVAGRVEIILPGRSNNKVIKDITAGDNTITINPSEYKGSEKRGATGKVLLIPISTNNEQGTPIETDNSIFIGVKKKGA